MKSLRTAESIQAKTHVDLDFTLKKGCFTRYNLVITLEQSLVLVIDLQADVNVVFRPFISEFFETVSLYYNITVLSMISKTIGEKIMSHIDPNGKYIKKKIFYKKGNRESKQIGIEEVFLSKNERPFSISVRNSSDLCLKKEEVEIMISAWENKQNDRVLMNLTEVLKDIAVSRVENLKVYLQNKGIFNN